MRDEHKIKYMRAVLKTVIGCMQARMPVRSIASRLNGLKLTTITRLTWEPVNVTNLLQDVKTASGAWHEGLMQLLAAGELTQEEAYRLLMPSARNPKLTHWR